MATALLSLVRREVISTEAVILAIEQFCNWVASSERDAENYRHLNTKQFIRSLYFRLEGEMEHSQLVSALRVAEKKLNRFEQ